MTAGSGRDALLDFLSDPIIVLRRRGEIVQANASAKRLLGRELRSANLFDFVLSPHDELDRYFARCSGTTAPLLGAAVLRNGNAGVRIRVECARLREFDGDARLALRCLPRSADGFSLLTERVRQLNQQVRDGLREKALLKEALEQQTVLARELQHRVKNNIQMIMSLITMSARGKESPLLDAFLDAARLRLQAMASAQEAIYQSQRVGLVEARPFLEGLVRAIVRSVAPTAELKLSIADVRLSSETAHAVALIVNELVTNAAKHGLQGGAGTIAVILEQSGGLTTLSVQDSGSGWAPDRQRRSSGLRLVRGLCRQIGGALELRSEAGTQCVVRFGDDG